MPAPAPPQNLGLALSGGGLRASFFHVGVLARLADCGLLRFVRVLSTVSGGSIVGALYYLCVKEAWGRGEPSDDDYRQIVRDVLERLSAAGRVDLRTTAFARPLKDLRMGADPKYSRSDRMAALYDEHLYRWATGGRRVKLTDLQFPGEPPLRILINATTLNTGHCWRFEATQMGEERRAPQRRLVDKNARLPRVRFDDPALPQRVRDFSLGHAVAASACFPGFQPLALHHLYRGFVVELVDGGVYDNQGVTALVHRGCDAIVVSDGSGQMEDQHRPFTRLLEVLGRSYSIASGRVREDQLAGMLTSEHPSAVVDLKAGLDPPPVSPDSPGVQFDEEAAAQPMPAGLRDVPDSTSHWRLNAEAQELLSTMRTDLDCFSEAEADSLMLAGYRIAAARLAQPDGVAAAYGVGTPDASAEANWPFAPVAALLDVEKLDPRYRQRLEAGRHRFFKELLTLPGAAKAALAALAVGAVVVAVVLGWHWLFHPSHTRLLVTALVPVALLLLFVLPMLAPPRQRERADFIGRFLVWGLLPFLLTPLIRLHLAVVVRLHLRRGRVGPLLRR